MMTPRRAQVSNCSRGGRWWRLPVAALLTATLALPLGAAATALEIVRQWARDIPREPDLLAWRTSVAQTSRVIAADGTELLQIPFRDQGQAGYRELARFAELPTTLVHAVLAAEDVRFFRHHGVDLHAVARATWTNLRAGQVIEGASTITQQVARNLLPEDLGRQRNLRRKFREALLARNLEKVWPKQLILETYVNFVFLGANSYGMRAAAHTYFARTLDELSLAQCALLAGLIQAPGRMDPQLNPDAALLRRNEVLARMSRAGFIDDKAGAAATQEPLGVLLPHRNLAQIAPWSTGEVRRQLMASIPDEVARGGLVIRTSVLPALSFTVEKLAQRFTQELARQHGPPQVAALVVDHHTGYIEAMVGGRQWDPRQFFNRVTGACRQPGSAWKPIVYAAALESGAITGATLLRDAPIAAYDQVRDVHWKPRSGTTFRGGVLAYDALAWSLNAPAIDVFDRVGAARVIAVATRLGISTPLASARPLALGASCVRPDELVRSYGIFSRGGWDLSPRLVTRVTRAGDALLDATTRFDPWSSWADQLDRAAALAGANPAEEVGAVQRERVVDELTAFVMVDMLAGVVRHGTATAARALRRPTAGKTGTTNDNTDAWFVGMTGRVVAGVWVGHDLPEHTLGPKDDGAQAALPLWMALVEASEGARPPLPVPGEAPANAETVLIDRDTGLLAAPGSGASLPVWMRRGTAPRDLADRPSGNAADYSRIGREF
jgi:penicillin-binding protein 1A